MVMIPRQDDIATVLPDRIPPPINGPQASPADFGAQVGQAVAGTGQGFDQVAQAAQQIRQIDNVGKINQATAQLQQAATGIFFGNGNGDAGFIGKYGHDAVDAYPQAQQALTKAQSDIMGTLPPDAQRQFGEYANRFVGNRLDALGDHYVQQKYVAADQDQKASLDADTSSAVGFYNDPNRFNAAVSDGRLRITKQAEILGESPEVTQDKLSNFVSGAFSGVALRIGQNDPVAGWKFYQDHLGSLTGPQQMEVEARLKPQLYAVSSRNDADNLMNGNAGAVGQGVTAEAQHQGVDPVLALTTAKIESGMGSRMQSPTSSASGVFGMMPSTFSENGGSNPGDVTQQISAGVKNLASSSTIANDTVGGNAAPWQVYLVHQQGAAGGPALLKAAAGESAVAALTAAYGGNATLATKAITGNGGTADMTVGDFRGLVQSNFERVASTITVPAPGTPPGTPTSTNPRDHLGEWLSAANNVMSPTGTYDPVYSDMVASRVRAKVSEIEEGQAQADRSSQNTLLSAALGLTSPNNPPVAPTAPAPGAAYAGPPAGGAIPAGPAPQPPNQSPLAGAAAAAGGNTPASRPTSIDALLATSPAVRAAWGAATPETQRGILSMIERNASEGPPITADAQTKFYGLLSESTRSPGDFLRENLADPNLLATMPREYVHQLMDRQASMDGKAVDAAERQISMTHARAVVMPDVLAAGINPHSTNATTAQAYAEFDGRLDEQLDQFQKQNGKRPSDDQIKTIGQTLLTPGFQRGTGSLWGLLPNDTSERLYQAQTAGTTGKFYPAVPAGDRAQIVSAYSTLNHGAQPSEAQIQTYFMAARSRASGPQAAPAPMLPPRSATPLQTASSRPTQSLPVARVDEGDDEESP